MPFDAALKTLNVFMPNASGQNIGELSNGSVPTPAAEGVPGDHQRFVYFAKYFNVGAASVVSVYESLGGLLQLKDQNLVTQNGTVQVAGDLALAVYRFKGSSFIFAQVSGLISPVSGMGIMMEFADLPGGA